MEASDTLTAAILTAFFKCPTKARFLVLGDCPQETYFSDVEAGISSMYKSRAWRMLHDRGELAEPATFGQIAGGGDDGTATRWFDCDTAVCDLALSQRGLAARRVRKSAPRGRIVPVLFSPCPIVPIEPLPNTGSSTAPSSGWILIRRLVSSNSVRTNREPNSLPIPVGDHRSRF